MIFFIVQICPLFEWLKNRWALIIAQLNYSIRMIKFCNSTYVWYIPLIPTFILSLIVIWQLYNQYFHLSVSTRTTLLCLYTLFITIVISNLGIYCRLHNRGKNLHHFLYCSFKVALQRRHLSHHNDHIWVIVFTYVYISEEISISWSLPIVSYWFLMNDTKA